MTDQPTLTLNDDRQIPQLGFGTWQLEGDTATDAVKAALDVGYWLIDTASIYKNEEQVGRGIGEWSDIFLQTKVWNDDQGYDEALAAFDASLARLGRDYVDMLLIHWPVPGAGKAVDTWKALIEARDQGKAKSIGVSNFREDDLKAIVDATGVVPALNQIELHPGFQQRELRRVHDDMGVITQTWSPLGQGKGIDGDVVNRIAGDLDAPASAVILAWHLQHGLNPLPRSSSRNHIAENFRALELTLSDDQMAAIDALDSADGRMGPDPSSF
ncbi:aldo/keto reductase [Erythrobacter arachoides]|uniref:Aldo/keto reductase n=1 Tax=Aurantiacibacter arachoides TaxID=1850444 RepID=A0A845A2Y8_9SPHN|nr:aldo/keto reductase [Aurantiacibacter arachoides]MXO93782.1 aldo/keto reductase [Aurantiacibacter arachoides]GGD46700.1 putative oxidoreductase [Aurantiacibacter arachoides]